jgi:hypothetical protein
LLASVEIGVVIAATDAGWTAEAHLISDNNGEHDGFVFLRDIDPGRSTIRSRSSPARRRALSAA